MGESRLRSLRAAGTEAAAGHALWARRTPRAPAVPPAQRPVPQPARAVLVVELGAERGPADGEALAAGRAPQAVVAAEAQEPPAGQVGAAAL